MKFNDHISAYDGQPFDFDAANAAIRELFAEMIFILETCLKTRRMNPLLKHAHKTRLKVFELVHQARQAARYKKKIAMLMDGPWRNKVMKELGGLPAMVSWYKRKKHGPKLVRQVKILLQEEVDKRAHAQRCAKASAHPRIFNDPYKMDQEGEFRLAPLPRFGREEGAPAKSKPEGEYEFDGTLMNDFRGHKAPISVWPEEFIAFAEIEAEIYGKSGPKVSAWLEAIAKRAEAERAKAKEEKAMEGRERVQAPP